ncbi:MAG: SRPBCC domain-containing protein [Microbacterium sp.]|nr:SRPBCC domain-containing protein [Microbacterium sp.]
MSTDTITIERTVSASPARVWELWTTSDGISAWWAPEGFRTDVTALDLRPEGELVYTMTAVAPEQIAFIEQYGMPLSTESRKRFVAIEEPRAISYLSLIDFVPDHEPYEHLTEVELHAEGDGTRVVMHVAPLHDAVWTDRLVQGRANELDNLAALVDAE